MTTAIFLSNRLQGARDEDVIGLDSVESYSVTETAKVTNHPVEDGTTVSDHYFLEPRKVSFSGVISPWNFSGQGTDLSPADFIREVQSTMVGKEPFSLYLSDDLDSIRNCVITSFEYRREAKDGKSVLVDVDVQEILRTGLGIQDEIDPNLFAPEVKIQAQNTSPEGDEVPKTTAYEDIESVFDLFSEGEDEDGS